MIGKAFTFAAAALLAGACWAERAPRPPRLSSTPVPGTLWVTPAQPWRTPYASRFATAGDVALQPGQPGREHVVPLAVDQMPGIEPRLLLRVEADVGPRGMAVRGGVPRPNALPAPVIYGLFVIIVSFWIFRNTPFYPWRV